VNTADVLHRARRGGGAVDAGWRARERRRPYPERVKLPRSERAAGTLIVLPEIGSTNDAMRALAAQHIVSEYAVIVTANQTAGRGRLGRVWVAPAGRTLALTVLLRPALPGGQPLDTARYGWFPLIAGAAMRRAVHAILPASRVGLKWPNDVQIGGAKVCGILTELLPDGASLIVGVGINLELTDAELPVPSATSLALAGVTQRGDELADTVLELFLNEFRALCDRFVADGGDAARSGIHDVVSNACATLGQEVNVQLPDGSQLVGIATGLDGSGRLLVHSSTDGHVSAVAAGDVTHLRYE
jgi:BirA family biotin operon repressor/biotin-[acetyl-CoA-carboxylase] ligase